MREGTAEDGDDSRKGRWSFYQEIVNIIFVPGQQDENGFLMMHPNSPFRIGWDIVILMPMLAYIIMVAPYRISFYAPAEGALYFWELAIDLIFLVDVVINFRTGYQVTARPCQPQGRAIHLPFVS